MVTALFLLAFSLLGIIFVLWNILDKVDKNRLTHRKRENELNTRINKLNLKVLHLINQNKDITQ